MLITNIKETDPLKVYGNGLTFNDENATSEEIIQFINDVPQEIKSLQFSEKSILPLSYGKITRLESLYIICSDREPLPEEILKIPTSRLRY
ncbi:MAG: hypothetical protein ACI85O_002951 [Saprospiraceae bacterium]|jgi:hypothetical protein